MGLFSWYMSLFEKKEKVESEPVPNIPAINEDSDLPDVSFNDKGIYSLDIEGGYSLAMKKNPNEPGVVSLSVAGRGVSDTEFVRYMGLRNPKHGMGPYTRVFITKIDLTNNPQYRLNRLRDSALAFIKEVKKTYDAWDEI